MQGTVPAGRPGPCRPFSITRDTAPVLDPAWFPRSLIFIHPASQPAMATSLARKRAPTEPCCRADSSHPSRFRVWRRHTTSGQQRPRPDRNCTCAHSAAQKLPIVGIFSPLSNSLFLVLLHLSGRTYKKYTVSACLSLPGPGLAAAALALRCRQRPSGQRPSSEGPTALRKAIRTQIAMLRR